MEAELPIGAPSSEIPLSSVMVSVGGKDPGGGGALGQRTHLEMLSDRPTLDDAFSTMCSASESVSVGPRRT